ncbi:MAG TPA: hypothetical protein VGC79_09495 [Polyangiaceae bacterium]
MKLQLNAGDCATIAFFALAVTLGCYAEFAHESSVVAPASAAAASATTANTSSSVRTAAAAVGLE